MPQLVLLIEPFRPLVNIIGFFLDELGFEHDVVMTADEARKALNERRYDCVMVNVDQNSMSWRDSALELADKASGQGIPVVMIIDHQVAATAVASNGWKPIQKPFTMENLRSAISDAISAERSSPVSVEESSRSTIKSAAGK
jgi:DNA-binding NtrC family response regulator